MCVLTDSQDRGNAKVFLRIHRGLHGRAHFLLCLYYGISSNPHYTRAVLWVSSTFLVFSSTFLLRFTNEILQFCPGGGRPAGPEQGVWLDSEEVRNPAGNIVWGGRGGSDLGGF